MQNDENVSLEDILMMLTITAKAVAQGGTIYLPLLQRLEMEYEKAQANSPEAYAKNILMRIRSQR